MYNDEQAMMAAAQSVVKKFMDGMMHKVLVTDPFKAEEFRDKKPFYAALVPEEIFKGSHFERKFVTPFGHVWEDLAVIAARYALGGGKREAEVVGNIKQGRLQRIAEVFNRLEHPGSGKKRRHPNWDEELAYVMQGDGEDIPVSIVCDVLAEDIANSLKYAFELKTPLVNIDIAKASKEKILKLHAMEPRMVSGAYFALPHNPYGKRREDYDWEFPNRWFNMKEDEVVLIGEEFWEKIGGTGIYRTFIAAMEDVGEEYKGRIYREFLGIEPP